ncbi:MAG: OadG family transporter subunit [Pseudomonadota bacterium]|nr:OadG family transporter subunit [Pseudomonadota bacterium]
MPESLASSGLTLMLLGMGTVFVFLTALVFATRLMSLAVGRIAPEAAPGPSADPDSTAHSKILDSEILAAITAAIHRHRSRHK